MTIYPYPKKHHSFWLVGLLSLAAVIGCGAPLETSSNEVASQEALVASPAGNDAAVDGADAQVVNIPTSGVRQPTKLIKNASLWIELADVDVAIAEISQILTQYQGDLLELSDQDSQSEIRRQVTLRLRIPQDNLDASLEALRALGRVDNQSITAEDVSTRLVDLQSRIRNLRKSEEALLEIMERSGSIADVLEVTQELSTVRDAIERSDAQLKSLQNRIAYSMISLTLVSTQPSLPIVSPVADILSHTWRSATSSLRAVSISLLQLLLWLLAFSPYIGILVLAGWGIRRYRLTQPPTTEQSSQG